MAVVQHKPAASDPKPLLLGIALLLLIVACVGGLIWWMLRAPQAKTIKLTEEQAKLVTETGPRVPDPPGPAFPAPPPLEQAPDPGPTRITLDLQNVTVPEALAALEKQSNIKLEHPNQGNPAPLIAMLGAKRINLELNNQPYWLAFRELAREANLNTYSSWDNRDKIQLTQGRPGELLDNPHVTAGSSMLVLKNVISRFNADLAAPRPGSRSLNVSMTAYVEPRLNAIKIMPNARVESAVDENGTSLLRPADPWDDRNSGNQRNRFIADIDVKLNFPPKAGQKIARLKGYVSVITGGKDETVKLKDPLTLKNHDEKFDGTLIRIVTIRKDGNAQYEARFQTSANSPMFSEWDDYSRPFKMFDANGKEFPHNGTWGGGTTRNAMDFGVYFRIEPGHSQPAELHITLPTQVREVRVPFEFTDLPLPH